jgi:hypothetical protein
MNHTLRAASKPRSARSAMIVLTDLHALCSDPSRSMGACAEAMRELAEHDVPVILVSLTSAVEVMAIQAELGICHPFICEGGGELHVPGGYFEELLAPTVPSEWNVIQFGGRGSEAAFERAVRLLTLLYWTHRKDGIVVGITDRERSILVESDVPVILRNPDLDQRPLEKVAAGAYVTHSTGVAGWVEAIAGVPRA